MPKMLIDNGGLSDSEEFDNEYEIVLRRSKSILLKETTHRQWRVLNQQPFYFKVNALTDKQSRLIIPLLRGSSNMF